jgi:hypothetical protein
MLPLRNALAVLLSAYHTPSRRSWGMRVEPPGSRWRSPGLRASSRPDRTGHLSGRRSRRPSRSGWISCPAAGSTSPLPSPPGRGSRPRALREQLDFRGPTGPPEQHQRAGGIATRRQLRGAVLERQQDLPERDQGRQVRQPVVAGFEHEGGKRRSMIFLPSRLHVNHSGANGAATRPTRGLTSAKVLRSPTRPRRASSRRTRLPATSASRTRPGVAAFGSSCWAADVLP